MIKPNFSDTKKQSLLALVLLLATLLSCNKKTAPNTDAYFTKIHEFKYVNVDSMGVYIFKLDSLYDQLPPGQQSYLLAFKGYYNSSKSKSYLAKNNCEKALEIAKQLHNDSLMAFAYNGLGIVFKNLNEFDLAVKNYLKSLQYFEKIKDYHGLSSVNVNLATMYQEKEDVKLANLYVEKTLDVLKLKANYPVYISLLHIKANLFGMAGQIDSALTLDKYALRLVDSLNYPKQKSQFFNNMALCMFFTNRLNEAENYFLESLKIDSIKGDLRLMTDSYIYLSQIYIQRSDYKTALNYNQLALNISKNINNPVFIASAYNNASDILKRKGDYANALKYKDSVIIITKKITSEKKEKIQVELTELYESEKKDKLLSEKSNQLTLFRLSFFFISVLILFAGISGFVYFKNYKKINSLKLNKVIEETNQNERIRISRDLHDNMGSYATSLLSQIDNLELSADTNPKIKDLRTDAENIMSTLRETIWILKTKTISVTQFFELLRLYAEKNLSKKLGINLKFTETVNKSIELSPTQSLNMYRIMQEVIQNIMKHAEASQVEFTLVCDDKITLTVEDNGIGFDAESLGRRSGLENMEYRATEINYEFKINSAPNGGTTVVLQEKS